MWMTKRATKRISTGKQRVTIVFGNIVYLASRIKVAGIPTYTPFSIVEFSKTACAPIEVPEATKMFPRIEAFTPTVTLSPKDGYTFSEEFLT